MKLNHSFRFLPVQRSLKKETFTSHSALYNSAN